jgi:hypothetical protein
MISNISNGEECRMEKRWLLRLPRELDSWLTLKAAEETVKRGRRISKNTLLIEIAARAKGGGIEDIGGDSEGGVGLNDVKKALEYIREVIEKRAKQSPAISERWKQRVSVNLKMVESYLEELDDW